MHYIPVAGTWERKREDSWIRASSDFSLCMLGHGLQIHPHLDAFNFWPTALSGSFCDRGNMGWQYGGDQLARFLRQERDIGPCVVIAHSHGGQVAAYAGCQERIDYLVTVDTPFRNDMVDVWAQANDMAAISDQQGIGHHLHCYGTGFGSTIRVLGSGVMSFFRHGFGRELPYADRHIKVPGGHSGILRDKSHMKPWGDILDWLRTVEVG